MIFLANRTNLDKRALLNRLHNYFQTQTSKEGSPVTQVRYHTSSGNKIGVVASVIAPEFLERPYTIDEAEIYASFGFPVEYQYDFYKIQWVEDERDLMIGWHQDETHMDLGECHLQIDYQGETVQREKAEFLDSHPMNVFDHRIDELPNIIDELRWENNLPSVPKHEIR